METSTVQLIKLSIVSATGLSKDALHIYVGLAVFLLASILMRKKIRSFFPLIAVLAVAVLGEAVDMRDDIAWIGYWRWWASLHDVLNTLFWPFVFFCLARWTSFLRQDTPH